MSSASSQCIVFRNILYRCRTAAEGGAQLDDAERGGRLHIPERGRGEPARGFRVEQHRALRRWRAQQHGGRRRRFLRAEHEAADDRKQLCGAQRRRRQRQHDHERQRRRRLRQHHQQRDCLHHAR